MSKITKEFREAVPEKDLDGIYAYLKALSLPLIVIGLIKLLIDYVVQQRLSDGVLNITNFSYFWMVRSITLYTLIAIVFTWWIGADLHINQQRITWVIWLAPLSVGLGLVGQSSGSTASLEVQHSSLIFGAVSLLSFLSYRYLTKIQIKKELVRQLSKREAIEQSSIYADLGKSTHFDRENRNKTTNKVSQTTINSNDEVYYKDALDEVEQNKQVAETWAKALTISKGDALKAKWAYVELRVDRLRAADIENKKQLAAIAERVQSVSTKETEKPVDVKFNRKAANREMLTFTIGLIASLFLMLILGMIS